ncbi:hypothetical protein DM860_001735 [Cuscuta australis]|uniref:DEP domain-containing protein n=1 Tax=Cuscuta australis TaxID=267555 RepID=A0A328E9S1_9ASTE|nr:hypothetical protein DM860_001735 [Cuscuta australis]
MAPTESLPMGAESISPGDCLIAGSKIKPIRDEFPAGVDAAAPAGGEDGVEIGQIAEESATDRGETADSVDDREEGDDGNENSVSDDCGRVCSDDGLVLKMIRPHSQLPRPEAPPGVSAPVSPLDLRRSKSMPESFDVPAIGKFFREKSTSLSAAITKRISSLMESPDLEKAKSDNRVTEFNLSGPKVIVRLKPEEQGAPFLGRVTFFSRSNCRDCTAVRSFLRERRLNFVEINVDVFPERENELVRRTGNSTVPQIFLNEKLVGGLVALNSLRNSGILEKKLGEMLSAKCPDDAPSPPVYGFGEKEERRDEMAEIVKLVRAKLPIQDRIMRMKLVKNCFAGGELVEVLIHHLDCGRRKAVEIGKRLTRSHFIHHVFGENEFEDGNQQFYRFLEHEPFIPKCYNFRGSTNDSEPQASAALGLKLSQIMSAILETYASEDRRRLDYTGISNSEEFRRYLSLVHDMQRVNLETLSGNELLAFFLNLYNAMAIHGVIRIGHPGGMIDRRAFFAEFQYLVGGYPYSLSAIKDGILRGNKRAPFALTKPFSNGDKRLQMAFPKVNPLIHFGLCNATRSSPAAKFFTPQSVESELRSATREFFQRDDAMQVDLSKRIIYLNRTIKWYSADFGQQKQILKWMQSYLDSTKAGLLAHLLSDNGPISIVHRNFDWSLNA